MFCLNLGYRWNLSQELNDVDAVIYLASGNSSERLMRKMRRNFSHILFDPQLYLAELKYSKSESVCGRLSTHPWFAVPGIDNYDSGCSTRSAWEKKVKLHAKSHWSSTAPTEKVDELAFSCVEYQSSLDCSQVILPSPMVLRREDEGNSLGIWLDAGLEAAEEVDPGVPLLATVAISDKALDESVFQSGGLLESIVDQVTSRDGLDGVYIVVGQSEKAHPLQSADIINRTYSKLVSGFSYEYDTVLTNFADLYGLACYALGASGFATGSTQSTRRLSLDPPKGGRSPNPVYYSHVSLGEYLPKTDLDEIAKLKSLKHLRDDTQFSRRLMRRLEEGGVSSSVPRWVESPGNTAQSQKHFISKLIEVDGLYENLDSQERAGLIEEWLDNADAAQIVIDKRLGRLPKGKRGEAASWSKFIREMQE